MDQSPLTNLYEWIRKIGIIGHKKRQEFLCELLVGLIRSRSVHFCEIADKMDIPILPSSIERRIQDFFQKVHFDYSRLILFFLGFIHHQRLILSLDRTEWDFGKTQINILCLVVSIGKMGVPLYFEMLENNSGNSNYLDRIDLFKGLLARLGIDRIEVLIMDREFIGHQWLKWLKQQGIAFCVRVPKHHKITLADGSCLKAEELLAQESAIYLDNGVVDKVVVNLYLGYDKQAELLYLIGTLPKEKLSSIYKKRWSIEVYFQALKGRGFRLEESRLRCIEKYKKLFAIVSMAYTLCWAIGIEDGRNNPVRPKNHGYPQYSVFRRGLNIFRAFCKRRKCLIVQKTINMASYRAGP